MCWVDEDNAVRPPVIPMLRQVQVER